MKEIKIYGEPNPVIGIRQYYSIHDIFGNAVKIPLAEPQFDSMQEESIKWSIWILIGDTWTKMTKNNKTGATVDYTFTPDSLTRKGIRVLVDANGEKAVLDIETKKTEEKGILYVEILDKDKKKPDRLFQYNEKIIARVHCLNMEKFPVTVTLWEDDGGKKNLNDISIDTQKGNVLNGKADIELYLNPKYAWLANARKAPGDDNEGAFHEYYVTAEFYQKVSKPSRDVNVVNPDYKNYPPAPKHEAKPKKEWPAEKKGPSKKEQRGIQTDRKVLDHLETKLKVENKISTKPFMDPINSYLTFNVGDSIWNQKKEAQNGNCKCCRIDKEIFFANYHKEFPEYDKKGNLLPMKESLKESLKKVFEGISEYYSQDKRDCDIKKIAYMLATIKLETAQTFNPVEEANWLNNDTRKRYFEGMYDSVLGKNEHRKNMALNNENTIQGDGAKYFGRGFVQITWKKNYRKMGEKFGVDLVNFPEKALEHDLAIKIMIYGSEEGKFTGKSLGDYINSEKTDYYNARRVINGIDCADKIENYAKKIEKCLEIKNCKD